MRSGWRRFVKASRAGLVGRAFAEVGRFMTPDPKADSGPSFLRAKKGPRAELLRLQKCPKITEILDIELNLDSAGARLTCQRKLFK